MTPKEQIADVRRDERQSVSTARSYMKDGNYEQAAAWMVRAAKARAVRVAIEQTDAWHKARAVMRQSKAGKP